MTRSVFAAALLLGLAAAPAAAQITNNYWLSAPPASAVTAPKPPSPPDIPNVPFAPARQIRIAAKIDLGKDFQPAGFAPLWLGPKAVALLGKRRGQLALLGWYNDFSTSRVLADPSTVENGTILDMAVSRDGQRLAIAAAAGNKLQVWTRDTQAAAPASVIAAIDGVCDKAGIAWLGGDTIAVGAMMEPAAAPTPVPLTIAIQAQDQPQTPQPRRFVRIVQGGAQKATYTLDLDCLSHIDPWTLTWSPNGQHAVARSEEQGRWSLLDRVKSTCSAINVPGIIPVSLIDWDARSRGFLFTAMPPGSPDPAHVGVMEYDLGARKARLLASPATAAAYVAGGQIAVLGSQRMNAAAIASNPDAPFPAEIAWVDPMQSRLSIVPTGFAATAAQLLHAHLSYAPASGLIATSFQTPSPKGAFTVLLWIGAAAHNGGVLGTGRMGSMLESWSPDGRQLAVLAGFPDHPTLAIVQMPQ